MNRLIAPFVALSLISAEAAAASEIRITPKGSQPSIQGAPENFTGTVRVDGLFKGDLPARVSGGTVTFEPGARTAWHTHPLGQTLIVTAGVGYVQQEGGPRQEIRPGDIVWIPPLTRHWHGATANTGMTHIAIAEAEDGKTVTWAEKVSQAQYDPATPQDITSTQDSIDTLSKKQQAIPLIAAFMATSDVPNLNVALNQGLDAGLTVSEAREILVQLYAYVGFPRSLNALNELMTVVQARKQRGIEDAPGREPGRATPTGDELLAAGTANQTKISGSPVKGPVFEFAPVINRFLQTHLFGDIFERDNLDWQSRELATVGALAATPGVEPQLRSHMLASLRVGLSAAQLRQVTEQLKKHGDAQTVERANTALTQALSAGESLAADYKKNPFTLAYDGAITKNEPGKVNIHPVSYKLNGLDIAANVYTPANYDAKRTYPTVVVAHPNGGVKEQVAGLYAQRLAEQGYITITADAAYQGASGGQPRSIDKPAYRIEDIHGMADFISQFAGVDDKRLGLLGICGGGGYSLAAAQTDKRFKSLATVSMFNSGRVRRTGYNDSQMDSIQQRLQQASAARAQKPPVARCCIPVMPT